MTVTSVGTRPRLSTICLEKFGRPVSGLTVRLVTGEPEYASPTVGSGTVIPSERMLSPVRNNVLDRHSCPGRCSRGTCRQTRSAPACWQRRRCPTRFQNRPPRCGSGRRSRFSVGPASRRPLSGPRPLELGPRQPDPGLLHLDPGWQSSGLAGHLRPEDWARVLPRLDFA